MLSGAISRRNWLRGILFCVCLFASARIHAQDTTASRTWAIEPHGRAWSEIYSPHDPKVFWDFGLDLTIWYQNPSRFEPFMYLQMRTSAGYSYSATEGEPRTPMDLLHQIWQQGLGVSWQSGIPVYLFAYRDCNHQLDKSGFDPVLVTTFMLAAGTLPPFRRDFHHFALAVSPFGFRWFIGAGPSPSTAKHSIWRTNSEITGEGWIRALTTYRAWPHGLLDANAELFVQTSDLEPNLRHVLRNEVGLTVHAGTGGWRFYIGRRWRDTRELWPVDQRTYWGLEYTH